MAAAFQAYMYGGFTPAAGVFATLTSLGMLGWANPLFASIYRLICAQINAKRNWTRKYEWVQSAI